MTDFQKGFWIGVASTVALTLLIIAGIKADCSSYKSEYQKVCMGLVF